MKALLTLPAIASLLGCAQHTPQAETSDVRSLGSAIDSGVASAQSKPTSSAGVNRYEAACTTNDPRSHNVGWYDTMEAAELACAAHEQKVGHSDCEAVGESGQ